ncbi:MAG: DUF1015 domain-containing protein, partial [Lachnospiraceae bacterium]|nr:DUF1015 domain-containing protein [Lachnospiraceae bacterium]
MPKVTPFQCIRPVPMLAARVAALPYDVYNRKEALAEVNREPLSFLRVDRAETQFADDVDTYDPRVYAKARELLDSMIAEGTFIMEDTPCYYLYELTMDGRSQTGLVACSSVDDYQSQIIKKHENTRADKELDRIRHVDATDAHTGPIFLVYRSQKEIREIVEDVKKQTPLYDFVSTDSITHRVWRIADPDRTARLEKLFGEIPCTYIADGHHRCASAVKVGLNRRQMHPGYTGREEYNRFLSVLFPDDQLYIMPYNRVVKDLNQMTAGEFLKAVEKAGFSIECKGKEPVSPAKKGTFGLYLSGCWYLLTADSSLLSPDPVKGLDVSILQDNLLGPVLNINDPRTDSRIDFVGGIRGLDELERRVVDDMAAAVTMYAT